VRENSVRGIGPRHVALVDVLHAFDVEIGDNLPKFPKFGAAQARPRPTVLGERRSVKQIIFRARRTSTTTRPSASTSTSRT
jgi:hypothetical protein